MLLRNLTVLATIMLMASEMTAKTIFGTAQLISVKDNRILKEAEISGKPLIMDFWATWCESCRKNLEKMDGLLRKQKSEANFLFVSMDEEGPDVVRSFFQLPEIRLSLNQIKARTYWDKNQELGNRLAKNGIPYMVAFDSRGKIIFEHDGVLRDVDWRRLSMLVAKEGGSRR